MKNKHTFIFLGISLFMLIIITMFLYYKYSNNPEEILFTDSVKLIVDKEIDKTIYNFSIKNTSNKSFKYNITFNSNDILNTNELSYDLVFNNNIIKSSKLETNNILDTNTIEANSIKNYSLIIKDTEDIQFNYKLSVTENNN